jgi:tetratricopeptide (TPR) repeat protein
MAVPFTGDELEKYSNLPQKTLNILVSFLTEAGERLNSNNELEPALAFCRHALILDSGYTPAWNLMATIFAKKKEFDLALSVIDNAIKIEPNNEVLWNSKGLILQFAEKYEESLSWFDKAISLNPDDPSYYLNKAKSLDKLGKDSTAEYANAEKLV